MRILQHAVSGACLLMSLVTLSIASPPAEAVTNITAAGPFSLSTSGETYVVVADLNRPGTDGLTVTADDITLNVNGHTITGGGSGRGIVVPHGTPVSGLVVTGPGVVQGFTNGLALYNTTNSVVQDLEIRNNTGDGIRVDAGSTDNLIQRCSSHDNGQKGARVWKLLDPQLPSDRNVFRNNNFSSNRGHGLEFNTSANFAISNTVSRNDKVGIVVNGTYDAHENTLDSNRVQGNGRVVPGEGIVLLSSSGNTLRRNQVSQNTTSGIVLAGDCDANLLDANTSSQNRYDGIWLSGDTVWYSGDADTNTLAGNQCNGNGGSGINLGPDGNDQNTLRSNRAMNNAGSGIRIEAGSVGNTATGNFAMTNSPVHKDLWDDNPAVGAPPTYPNSWSGNTFRTKGGAGAGGIS